MPDTTPSEPAQAWGNTLERTGRAIVLTLVFLVPLAFLKETHYIFQIKTTLIQLGGWSLALVILIRLLLPERSALVIHLHPWVLLLVAWAGWMAFKSWNSIAPEISMREASRLIWLPLLALSILIFFKKEEQKNRLLDTLVFTALLTTFFATLIRFEDLRDLLMPSNSVNVDLFDFPILPWLLKPFFFPSELELFFKNHLSIANDQNILPINLGSFFPEKPEAGTFGNKNFLAGYLNLTLPLVLWKFLELLKRVRKSPTLFEMISVTLLVLALVLQLFHLVTIGNRASWLGMLGAMGAFGILMAIAQGSMKKVVKLSFLPLILIGILSLVQPKRITSMLNPFQNSNELRLLTWGSWLNGFVHDDSWEGFSSGPWRLATGWGNHSFRVAYPLYRSDRIFKIENNLHSSETSHAHNHYLNTLGEKGGIGLILDLLLFFTPIFALGALLIRDKKERLLPCLLSAALISQLIQACFSVAPRYTGVSFQFWITLGLLVGHLPPPKLNFKPLRRSLGFSPWALPLLGLLIMPDPSWPLRWLQSQHFHAQAQIFQAKAKTHHRDAIAIEKKLSSTDERENENLLKDLQTKLSHHRRQLSKIGPLADLHYDLAFDRDPAHIESPYLGAVMKIQFGNQHLRYRQSDMALQLFEEGIEKLVQVKTIAPYFVQTDYWLGIAYKGLAMTKESLQLQKPWKEDLLKALSHFDSYSTIDPFFPELPLESFYCHYRLGHEEKADRELKKILFNTIHYGSNLYREDPRFDSIRVSQFLHDRLDEPSSDIIQTLLKVLHHFQSSTCLLPQLPKTQRHVKNSFHILQDPHEL